MRQIYFIIAESVHMYPVAKLVIVGTFDTINATTVPITVSGFGIAVRLEGEGSDRGRAHKGLVTLRKLGGEKPLFSLPLEFSFPKGKGQRRTFAVLALGVPPLRFESPGKYVFELKIEGKIVGRSMLYVRKVAEDRKEQSANKTQRRSSGWKK